MAAATRVRILTFWAGTGALRRRMCVTCAWPPAGKIGPSLCLYGRASIIPAPTWREDGSAEPGWETYHLSDAFVIFPRVTQKPLTLSRSAVLEWKAILGTEIPSAVSGTGTRKHEGDSGWDADWREGWDRLEYTAAATRATMPEIIGYGMGGIPHGDRASGHRAAGRPIVRPTSRPRGLGKSSSLQTCALWLLWVTKRRAAPR